MGPQGRGCGRRGVQRGTGGRQRELWGGVNAGRAQRREAAPAGAGAAMRPRAGRWRADDVPTNSSCRGATAQACRGSSAQLESMVFVAGRASPWENARPGGGRYAASASAHHGRQSRDSRCASAEAPGCRLQCEGGNPWLARTPWRLGHSSGWCPGCKTTPCDRSGSCDPGGARTPVSDA